MKVFLCTLEVLNSEILIYDRDLTKLITKNKTFSSFPRNSTSFKIIIFYFLDLNSSSNNKWQTCRNLQVSKFSRNANKRITIICM